jgi:hypothetical protein
LYGQPTFAFVLVPFAAEGREVVEEEEVNVSKMWL